MSGGGELLLLGGVLVALRLVSPLPPAREPWRGGVDVPLLVVAGSAYAGVAAFLLGGEHVLGFPLTASDFAQYCENLVVQREGGVAGLNAQRSWWVGAALAPLARHWGVLGALALGAAGSGALLGAAIFLHARVVAGRAAGALALVAALACGPVVMLSRTATWYPEVTAVCVGAVALGAAALVEGGLGWVILGGVGAGAALLVDVRGFAPGLVTLGLVVLAALRAPPAWIPLRLGLALLPVAGSYGLAQGRFVVNAPGLFVQTWDWVRAGALEAGLPPPTAMPAGHDWLWGRSALVDVPTAIVGLLTVDAQAPAALGALVRAGTAWRHGVLPVAGALLVLVPAGLLARRHEARPLLALGAGAVPGLLAAVGAARVLPYDRYLGLGFAGLCVPAGVGLAAWLAADRAVGPVAVPRAARTAVVLGVLAALLAGLPPTALGPRAAWRRPAGAGLYPAALTVDGPVVDPADRRCAAALAADRAAGLAWLPYRPFTRLLPPEAP